MTGDSSQPNWEDAPELIKNSAIEGVLTHLRHPFLTPEQAHTSWVEYKRSEGWIWGPRKDLDKREHPLLVPYGQLASVHKVKDYLFKSIVNSIAAEGQVRAEYEMGGERARGT